MIFPKDLASLARFILSPECKSICILSGAGVSCASGIPDFRSPGGMYDTLEPKRITATEEERRLMAMDPTYVVEKNMFMRNSYPYLEVRRPFMLGTQQKKWKATIAHRFAELLHVKTSKLTRVYTQNIDGLDHQCQKIPTDKIVNVHGTLAEVACESCGADHDFDEFCQQVRTNIKDIYDVDSKAPSESSPIACRSCGRATVKPKTVLFGSGLPGEFFTKSELDMPSCDMLIVAGTSLVVSPANSLVYRVADEAVRLVINRDEVGQELGITYDQRKGRDFFMGGDCDEQFLKLVEELGWLGELGDIIDELPEESARLVKNAIVG
mmetsp:Transcript_13886/g.23108  ORF Transcript_13886/g.23108 Transcript_13886/m.23108 type:complete len:324 (-) Transcript_13886:413-1384(-)